MSTQHTPAPWLIADNDSSFIYALNDDGTNRFHFSIQTGYVQQLRDKSIRTSPEEIAANAALICAAPDLLDALIDATDNCLWRSDSDIPLSADESQRIYNKAMAAIAKAKQLTNNNQ